MTSFRAGDFVWVSFPHVETERTMVRPLLVIPDHTKLGLPIESKIRTARIATLQSAGAEKTGRIDDDLLRNVQAEMRRVLGR